MKIQPVFSPTNILKTLLLCLLFPSVSIADSNEKIIEREIAEAKNTINEAYQPSSYRRLDRASWPSSHPSHAVSARFSRFDDFFDFYMWRDEDDIIWVEVSPGAFVCSSSFSLIQDNIQYDTVKLETLTGDSQCNDVLVTSFYKLTQWSFHTNTANLNETFTLAYTSDNTETLDFLGKDSGAVLHNSPVYFLNPASNSNQRSILRLLNHSSESTTVKISAIDDRGNPAPGGDVEVDLPAHNALEISSPDLENGNTAKGLRGNFGDGIGKWRLSVQSDVALQVKSILKTPQGYENDLSQVLTPTDNVVQLMYVNGYSATEPHSFLRIINPTSNNGTVTITGRDDEGTVAQGSIIFTLKAQESKQINSGDLETGNVEKGLNGAFGNGVGKWHLEVTSSLDIKVMSLVRTPDGFLSNFSH